MIPPDSALHRIASGSIRSGAALLCTLLCCLSGSAVAQTPGLVPTTEGDVQGATVDGISAWQWLGIPYAAPPVGAGRFARPADPLGRAGTLVADTFPNACPQTLSGFQLTCGGDGAVANTPAGDEDCLALSIWSPGTSWPPPANLPVLFFIHGGSNLNGCNAEPLSQGASLAANGGAVVVNIQYRLGAFGFLATEELAAEDPDGSAGNWALLDQIKALEWVRANIAGFGGDPDNITVFGESAGAQNTCVLLASPLTDGLFERAIVQSISCAGGVPLRTSPGSPIEGRTKIDRGTAAAEALGCDTPGPDRLSCLRGLSRDELLTVGTTGGPTIDGVVLENTPLLAFEQGAADGRSVIVGSNRDEMTLFTFTNTGLQTRTETDWEGTIRDAFGDEEATQILPFYPEPAAVEDRFPAYQSLVSEAFFNCPTFDTAGALARGGSAPFLYHFTELPGGLLTDLLRSFHALELFYLFGTLDEVTALGGAPDAGDTVVSQQMQTAWSSFASMDSPGLLPAKWPTFNPDNPRHYEFNATLEKPVSRNFRGDRCERLLQAQRSQDGDRDNVEDEDDNCPFVANVDQWDDDQNGVGDACESACVFCGVLANAKSKMTVGKSKPQKDTVDLIVLLRSEGRFELTDGENRYGGTWKQRKSKAGRERYKITLDPMAEQNLLGTAFGVTDASRADEEPLVVRRPSEERAKWKFAIDKKTRKGSLSAKIPVTTRIGGKKKKGQVELRGSGREG